MEKEASLEEQTRIRKKEKAKERGRDNRRMDPGQPLRKKRRMTDEEVEVEAKTPQYPHVAPQEVQQEQEETRRRERRIQMETPLKRKVGKEEMEKKRTPKKPRRNHDIKRYITCKRWKEEEEEIRRKKK